MAKDYSKIKALAQSILECIGDEPEGENPSLPSQDDAIDDGGQEELDKTPPSGESTEEGSEDEKKKKKDASLAMMGSMLASKFSNQKCEELILL